MLLWDRGVPILTMACRITGQRTVNRAATPRYCKTHIYIYIKSLFFFIKMIVAEKSMNLNLYIYMWFAYHSWLKFVASQTNTRALYHPPPKQSFFIRYPMQQGIKIDVPPRFLSVSPNCERAGCRSRSMPAEDRCYNWWTGGTLRYWCFRKRCSEHVLYMQTREHVPNPSTFFKYV